MRVATVAGACLLATSHVMAHGGGDHAVAAGAGMSAWDIGVVVLLAAVGLLYARGTMVLRARGATPRRFEQICFVLGWAVLVMTVLPPLDTLSVELFSAHMVQHELMMLVGAPLLIAGRPLPVWLVGLPTPIRRPAAVFLQSHTVGGAYVFLTAPLTAWTLHGGAIWMWHLPALYQLAVAHEGIHALQHAMFVGTSCLFWWGMLYGRYGRAGYGAGVFYVFTTAVHTGILGALLTFARVPLYPIYAAPAARRGVDLVGDQEAAGLLMWIPAGIVLTMLGLALFAAWLGEAERRQRAGAR